MKTNEPLPYISLNKQPSLNGSTSTESSQGGSYKNHITSTPINNDYKHPELINAPTKTEDSSNIEKEKKIVDVEKKNNKDKLGLRSQMSFILPNYKDLNLGSAKTLEDQNSAKNKTKVVENKSSEKKRQSDNNLYIVENGSANCTKITTSDIDSKTIRTFSINDKEITIGTKQKYRRNSISELKYECLAAKADLNKEKNKINALRNKSIDKIATSTDFSSKMQNKVFPVNEHPHVTNNTLFMMKKLNRDPKNIPTSSTNNKLQINNKK